MSWGEWVPCDPFESDPNPMPTCDVGFAGHTWEMTVEEGQVTLSPIEPCPLWYDAPVCSHVIACSEMLGMAPITVRLALRVETCGYYEVEHDVYIDIIPERAVSV